MQFIIKIAGYVKFAAISGWRSIRSSAASASAPLTAMAVAGCSIHPVQQDVTRAATRQIVNQIRCEARLAVLDKAIDELKATAIELSHKEPSPQLTAAQIKYAIDTFNYLALDLISQRKRGGPVEFNPLSLPTDDAVRFYNRYINTVIAYDFRFDVTEENKATASADPVRLISGGFAGLGVSGTSTLNRNNIRQFALSDSFEYLMFNKDLECISKDYLADNFVYPVAGNVGLKNAIDTFIDLYEETPLKRSEKSSESVFADTLRFTTRLDGSIGPRIRIEPLGTNFGLTTPASADFSAYRNDIHTLTIGIAKQPDGKVPLLAQRQIRRLRMSGQLDVPMPRGPVRSNNMGSVKNGVQKQNENAAFRAIDGIIQRNFFEGSRLLQIR